MRQYYSQMCQYFYNIYTRHTSQIHIKHIHIMRKISKIYNPTRFINIIAENL